MSLTSRSYLLLVIVAAVSANEGPRIATANIGPRDGSSANISGSIQFTETDNGLRVTGSIIGLPAGNYGFHVHELGDITTCDTSGPHFNPDATNHGGRDHAVRHVGDLGNVVFNAASVANIDFTDTILSLNGRNNIIGRTLVLHAQEDDLGLGGHEQSLSTGNAGARVACGVIGIRSLPNSAVTSFASIPTLLLFVTVALFGNFR